MMQLVSCPDPLGAQKSPFGVDFDLSSSNVRNQEADLFLDINLFSEYESLKLLGAVEVGFKRIHLKLQLTGSTMPLKSRNLIAALPPTFTTQRKISRGEEQSASFASEAGFEATAAPKIKSTGKQEESKKTSTQVEDQFSVSQCTVYATGYDSNPSWRFEEKQGNGVLLGGFKKQKLGVLRIHGNPCTVSAEFTAMQRDLILSGASGLFPTHINNSHRAVRKILIWAWLNKKIAPHLSRKYFEVK